MLVGVVPLLAVTSFVLDEGYKIVPIAGSLSTQLKQMVAPTTKTISIEALLIGEFRALRPALEAMALTSRLLACGDRAAHQIRRDSGDRENRRASRHANHELECSLRTIRCAIRCECPSR